MNQTTYKLSLYSCTFKVQAFFELWGWLSLMTSPTPNFGRTTDFLLPPQQLHTGLSYACDRTMATKLYTPMA